MIETTEPVKPKKENGEDVEKAALKKICNLMDLPNILLLNCLSFVGNDHYLFVGGVSKTFLRMYRTSVARIYDGSFASSVVPMDALKMTSIHNAVSSVSCADMAMKLIYEKAGRNYQDDKHNTATHTDENQYVSKDKLAFKLDKDDSSLSSYPVWEFFTVCAAFKGNIDVLSWIQTHPNCVFTVKKERCSWKKYISNQHKIYGTYNDSFSPFQMASRGDHLDTVKWLYSSIDDGDLESEHSVQSYICQCAIRFNKLSILKWAQSKGFPLQGISSCCEIAAQYNHLDVLKWLHKNGCPWKRTAWKAICCGHLDILKYCVYNGYKLNSDEYAKNSDYIAIRKYAARNGHLDILKWAFEYGITFDEETCAEAALGGHLDVLKWARQNNCPWNEVTTYFAKQQGHLEIYNWAVENGCPVIETTSFGFSHCPCCSNYDYDYDSIVRNYVDRAETRNYVDLAETSETFVPSSLSQNMDGLQDEEEEEDIFF